MTFLEFVCRNLYGRPAYKSDTAYWNCPFHHDENPSFHILPYRKGKKTYFKCFGCGEWGDEFDLLKNFNSSLTYEEMKDRLRRLRAKYENTIEKKQDDPKSFNPLCRELIELPLKPTQQPGETFDDYLDRVIHWELEVSKYSAETLTKPIQKEPLRKRVRKKTKRKSRKKKP